MNLHLAFALCGIIGPLFCAAGDLLLDIKGKDNVKRGKYGIMDSAWDHMDVRRFTRSILLAMVGTPLAFLGMTALAGELGRTHETFALVFWLSCVGGCAGSFFIHTFICLLPVVYKKVEPQYGFDHAEELINTLYEAVKLPFWVFYTALVILPQLMLIWALLAGNYLTVSRWWVLATLPVLMGLGAVLDKLKHDWFCDLPMVITPSLSLSAMGLIALLNML